jgi:hypothetical protein
MALNLAWVMVARKQNRIGGTPHTFTYWHHRLDAGRTKSASGACYIKSGLLALHFLVIEQATSVPNFAGTADGP